MQRILVLALVFAMPAVHAMAGSFNDAQDGNYDVNATWVGGTANPAGGGADSVLIDEYTVKVTGSGQTANDTIYASGNGVLYVETGNEIARLDGSTIYVRDGGRLRYPRTWINAGSTAKVIADSGMAVLESGDVQNGGLDAVMNCASLLCTGTLSSLKLQVMTGAPGGANPGIGFTNAIFAVDTVVNLSTNLNHLQLHRVALDSERTLSFSGVGNLIMRAVNDTSFAGTVDWNSSGNVEVRSANALGYSTWNLSNGAMTVYNAYSASNAIVNVMTGVVFGISEDGDNPASERLTGATIRMMGGMVRMTRKWVDIHLGGTLVLAAPGSVLSVQNENSSVQIWEGLIVESDGASLDIDRYTPGAGAYITSTFTNNHVRGNGSITMSNVYCRLTLDNTRVRLGKTLSLDGPSTKTLGGWLGVEILGGADLLNSSSCVLITNAGSTIADSSTWEDSTLVTKAGSPATAITATLTGGANKGTIDNGHGSVSFASSDLGYVTVEGLRSGGGANARLVIIEFDSPSDLVGIQSKLEAAHPDWTKFFRKGSNKIGFTLTPTMDGTGYFAWDNKHFDLGADVLSIWFGPPDRGTVIQIL